MRIGLLTFHWGTNYGGVLQAYCMQEHLTHQGHEVEIINYKPRRYDYPLLKILRHPKTWKSLGRTLVNLRKESLLIQFREKYLKTTHRYHSVFDLAKDARKYDVFVSGSDQILNPSFTLEGENGSPSSAYWLSWCPKDAKRIGYSISFGCEVYPPEASYFADKWVNSFDAIGVRERSGLDILDQLGYEGEKTVTPDPTLLLGKEVFKDLNINIPAERENYTCVYMLRRNIRIKGNVFYIDDIHRPLSMEQWLTTIVKSNRLITNSYHGMIIALLSHVPFAVLLEESTRSRGMNDRFITLLSYLGIRNRIVSSVNEIESVFDHELNYLEIDRALSDYKEIGVNFINRYLF